MYLNSRVLLFILISLFFTSTDIYAQQGKCNIIGAVVDENQEPISYASVAIYSEKTITGVVTNDNGKFSLNIAQGNSTYRLTIDFVG